MSKGARKLEFNKNNCLISCSTGWQIDKQGYKGVWCSKNGRKYFIRKGESVLDALQRPENNYVKPIKKTSQLDSQVRFLLSSKRKAIEKYGSVVEKIYFSHYIYTVKMTDTYGGYEIVSRRRNI